METTHSPLGDRHQTVWIPFAYQADGTLPTNFDILVEGVKRKMLDSLRASRSIAVGRYYVQHTPDHARSQIGKLYVTVSVERV